MWSSSYFSSRWLSTHIKIGYRAYFDRVLHRNVISKLTYEDRWRIKRQSWVVSDPATAKSLLGSSDDVMDSVTIKVADYNYLCNSKHGVCRDYRPLINLL